MPTTQASPAVGATRPLRRRAATGRGRDFTPNAVFQEGKGKTDALTLLSQAYFFGVLSRSSSSGAQARPDRDRIPAFSKAGIRHPPPATAATPPKPRRPPPPMRVGYADHAGVAGRRGYAPATQARCDGEGRDFTPNAVSKRVRAKLMPLPSYRKRIFSECCQGQAFWRASATLTEIEYPLLVKRVFAIPSPPPRLRR